MRCHYVLDEGLPVPCQTGAGKDTIASLQSAIKYLVKSKEVMACKQEDIQIFLPGTTVHNFRERTPLRPEEKIPHTTEKEFLFAHARRDYQDLTPEERRLYADPQYDNEPKAKPKPMARPPATQLKMNKPKEPTPEEKAAAAAKKKAEEQRKKDEEERKRKEAEAEAARKAEEKRQQEEAARKAEEDRLKAEAERKAKEARLRAEEEARKAAEEKARKAAEAARKKAAEEEEARRKAEREKYVPTPMDMSTQKCWYQLEGDMCAYYIRFNGYEKAGDLKEHILATRRTGKNAALLDGIEDLADLKLIPPGVESGKEIGPQETLPSGTTMDTPILVIVKESNGMGRTLTPYS